MEQLSGGIGESIPWAYQDWANAKVPYSFHSHPQVSEAEILKGHFQATGDRLRSGPTPILMLHDKTEFNYHRDGMAAIVISTRIPPEENGTGVCGIRLSAGLKCTPALRSRRMDRH
jgi:hypothetical protein